MQQRVRMNSSYARFIRNRMEGSHFIDICRIVTFSLSIVKNESYYSKVHYSQKVETRIMVHKVCASASNKFPLKEFLHLKPASSSKVATCHAFWTGQFIAKNRNEEKTWNKREKEPCLWLTDIHIFLRKRQVTRRWWMEWTEETIWQ